MKIYVLNLIQLEKSILRLCSFNNYNYNNNNNIISYNLKYNFILKRV